MALKKGFLFTKGNCSLFHSFISMGGGIWGGWVIGNFVYILFTFLALSIYKFSVVAQKPFFHFDHSIVAPLPKPTKQVVKMNELEAKKFAADSAPCQKRGFYPQCLPYRVFKLILASVT